MSYKKISSYILSSVLLSTASQVASPAVAATPTCFGKNATIVRNSGGNTIRGTAGTDVIVAGGGADRIDGRDGNDVICAGAGRDLVIGGEGRDEISGGGKADTVSGGAGKDRLKGVGGDDTLNGGTRADLLSGGRGTDACFNGERFKGCESSTLTPPPPPPPPPGDSSGASSRTGPPSRASLSKARLTSRQGSSASASTIPYTQGAFDCVLGFTNTLRGYKPAVAALDTTGYRDSQHIWWIAALYSKDLGSGTWYVPDGAYSEWMWSYASDDAYSDYWTGYSSGRQGISYAQFEDGNTATSANAIVNWLYWEYGGVWYYTYFFSGSGGKAGIC